MDVSRDLKNSCYQMLRRFPLHRFRKPAGDSGFYDLNVLIRASGSAEDTFELCREILPLGQLLNTRLTVTIYTDSGEAFAAAFLKKAPFLDRYVQVLVNGRMLEGREEPDQDYILAGLFFENVPDRDIHAEQRDISEQKEGDEGCDCSNADPAEPSAGSPRTFHYIVVMEGSADAGLVFVDPAGHSHEIFCSDASASADAPRTEFTKADPVEEIAFHLHYTYAKSADSRQSYERILRDFRIPYNYNANIKAAIHVRSKLACCGIYEEDMSAAAEKFADLMEQRPEVVDQLSALEHDRWTMDKILSGYRQMEDVSRIYQKGAATHCSDRENLWHSCLLPCDRTGKSHLTEEDWRDVDRAWKETGGDWNAPALREVLLRNGRDPLDQMSLRIHLQCGKLARSRKGEIESILNDLRTFFLTDEAKWIAEDELHARNGQKGVMETAEALTAAVHQMWHHSRNAASLYGVYSSALRKATEGETKAAALLDHLDEELAPLIEYVADKDYKELDRLFIRQIPYDLTLRCGVSLWKLLSGHETTDFYSAWVMEPGEVVYLAAAESQEELLHIFDVMHNLRGFFQTEGIPIDPDCRIFIPAFLSESICAEPGAGNSREDVIVTGVQSGAGHGEFREVGDGGRNVIVTIPRLNETELLRGIEEMMGKSRIDYLDVTGADALLARAAERAAEERGAGIFYIRNRGMHSLARALELEYEAPMKEISVRDMFLLSGAFPEGSESGKLGDFTENCSALWEIAFAGCGGGVSGSKKGGNGWDDFCGKVRAAYKPERSGDLTYTFRIPAEAECACSRVCVSASSSCVHELIQALHRLERMTAEDSGSFVRNIAVSAGKDGNLQISFDIREDVLDPDRDFQEYLRKRCSQFRAGRYFAVKMKDGQIQLVYHNYQVKGLNYDGNTARILEAMSDRSRSGTPLITNLKKSRGRDHSGPACSFSFASREVLSCIQLSGRILEYYIYYSALLYGHFHDVEMGLKYQHMESEDAAENELDVICTKGMSSLFISAKMANISGNFNYILYEIALQAERFGIHGKAVLAAPFCSQFDAGTGEYSREVRKALSRKVYLLGGECFHSQEDLGRVLDNIVEGRHDWCDFLRNSDAS